MAAETEGALAERTLAMEEKKLALEAKKVAVDRALEKKRRMLAHELSQMELELKAK